MVQLTGKNLGERQRDLNNKVKEAFQSEDFEKYRLKEDYSDADKLFKIDLGAKYKNIDYFIEIVKTNDNLYVTRALNKCDWICDSEFASFINPGYLNENIFPLISTKLKIQILKKISCYLKNENTAVDFYTYCVNNNLLNIAAKFFLKTSESFKLSVINEETARFILNHEAFYGKETYFKHFIGNSFALAEEYMYSTFHTTKCLNEIKYLYSIDDTKYLDLIEKHGSDGHGLQFGKTLSKDVMIKHKQRVLKKPAFYCTILCRKVITAYSKFEDAVVYLNALLPEKSHTFFANTSQGKYQFILDIVPKSQIFQFLKEMFEEKYPGEEFEMSDDFSTYDFHEFMSESEKETWALRHIERSKELLGVGYELEWYKYVTFDKAFEEIKKVIQIMNDKDKRISALCVLINSAKSEEEKLKLLKYFYERHVNEHPKNKEMFVNRFLSKHTSLDISKDCWMELEKIFYSLSVFDQSKYSNTQKKYRHITLVYYVINGMKMLDIINEFLDTKIISLYNLRQCTKLLKDDKEKLVFDFMLQYYIEKVNSLSSVPYEKVKLDIQKQIENVLDLIEIYGKKTEDIPEIIMKYINLDFKTYEDHSLFGQKKRKRMTHDDIKKLLKKDASLVVSNFNEIEEYISSSYISSNEGKINWLLKKIKIYFADDIGPKYIEMLNKCLTDENVSYTMRNVAVYGLITLANQSFNVEFVTKHVPANHKIDHANISSKLLSIQQAICSYVCFSRPPLPLDLVKQYIKGDYVHNCLPMFNSYFVNLPQSKCNEFIEILLASSVSVQKHGIRLAYNSFKIDDLVKLITKIWQRNKNISLRAVVFTSLYKKVESMEKGKEQDELFELLKIITLDIKKDDSDDIFKKLCSLKPEHLRGPYLEVSWKTLIKIKEKSNHFLPVIYQIKENISNISEEFLDHIAIDYIDKIYIKQEEVSTQKISYEERNLKKADEKINREIWSLIQMHLFFVRDENLLKSKLDILKIFLNKSLENWHLIKENEYIARQYVKDLVDAEIYNYGDSNLKNLIILYDNILEFITEKLPEKEIYTTVWRIKITKIYINTVNDYKLRKGEDSDAKKKERALQIALKFGERIGELMTEYINQQKYYISFSYFLYKSFKDKLLDLLEQSCFLDISDLFAAFMSKLLLQKQRQIYFFAAEHLEKCSPFQCLNEYLSVIEMLRSYEDEELQFYLHNEFSCFLFTQFQIVL